MVEIITTAHKLYPFLVLYNKETNAPILDPCFSEYKLMFTCGHDKSLFRENYTAADQYCAVCDKMVEVKDFVFTGANSNDLDREREEALLIETPQWNCETKEGLYIINKTKKMGNDKYIAHRDWTAAPDYGTFTEEQKKAGKEFVQQTGTAVYKDKQALTVFEVPEEQLYDPNVVKALREYLQVKDVKAYKMRKVGRRHDGIIIFRRGDEITKDIPIPEPPKML